jgi:hypothetical protein
MKILSKWRIFVTLAEKYHIKIKRKISVNVCILENVYGKSFLEGKFQLSRNGGRGSFLV